MCIYIYMYIIALKAVRRPKEHVSWVMSMISCLAAEANLTLERVPTKTQLRDL